MCSNIDSSIPLTLVTKHERVSSEWIFFNLLMSTNMSKASSSVLLLKKSTNKRQQQQLRDAFKKADKNGDGKLSYDEYWEVVRKSNIK